MRSGWRSSIGSDAGSWSSSSNASGRRSRRCAARSRRGGSRRESAPGRCARGPPWRCPVLPSARATICRVWNGSGVAITSRRGAGRWGARSSGASSSSPSATDVRRELAPPLGAPPVVADLRDSRMRPRRGNSAHVRTRRAKALPRTRWRSGTADRRLRHLCLDLDRRRSALARRPRRDHLGEQPRHESLPLADSLDLDRDGVDGLLEVRQAIRDLGG